ncbi:hypothetical protein EYF80_004136 [Liparis tanakae]|uniref:Uncharacterized protein n=1 Tax=Liparis tanakae TaxID=230148 RepID=A0A4Z2J7D2_9TELE|nr:hypothetical protein EYF80_004136 [Liparis tanakae]
MPDWGLGRRAYRSGRLAVPVSVADRRRRDESFITASSTTSQSQHAGKGRPVLLYCQRERNVQQLSLGPAALSDVVAQRRSDQWL